MSEEIPHASFGQEPDDVERAARAIYELRPDYPFLRIAWPETARDRRAYPHNPVAAIDLSFAYAKAAIRALKEKPMMQHSLRRTSPKRGPFLGTCVNCGTPNLTFEQSREECPNQRGVSQEDAIIEAVRDDRNDTLQQVGYIRNSAIEECAQELEIRGRSDLAAAIRALKDKS